MTIDGERVHDPLLKLSQLTIPPRRDVESTPHRESGESGIESFDGECRRVGAVGELSVGGRKNPKIVLILADDMGYGDPTCYNPNSRIPTPNIDRLAPRDCG
ncbi:MAG: hypothetical protein Ct9H300mP1_36860 [Planctomycetaceae bacterium]|nr:MAG: hypothetical protein Ct9H300mP1_36860 [Planctomycetaceae bacterium]